MHEWHIKAMEFNKQIRHEYKFSPDELSVLDGITDNLSNYWKASEQLNREGLTIGGDGQIARKHPACEISKISWGQFLAGCRLLGICRPQEPEKRPYNRGG